jgi:ribonuclease VapC
VTRPVLDASALLAFLHGEDGADTVEEALASGAVMSAVNWAEVLGKLAELGEDPETLTSRLTKEGLLGAALAIVPLEADDATRIATLRRDTRRLGLSLGDCACLALALRLGAPALTADHAWADLDLGIEVTFIREPR